MLKKDEKILQHLAPIEYQYEIDTYFCSITKQNKERFIYSVEEKVKSWVKENGGNFERLTGKIIRGQRKGFVVKITFPGYGKRDMKNIMASLY